MNFIANDGFFLITTDSYFMRKICEKFQISKCGIFDTNFIIRF